MLTTMRICTAPWSVMPSRPGAGRIRSFDDLWWIFSPRKETLQWRVCWRGAGAAGAPGVFGAPAAAVGHAAFSIAQARVALPMFAWQATSGTVLFGDVHAS